MGKVVELAVEKDPNRTPRLGLIPRPAGLPVHVSDETLCQAVAAYCLRQSHDEVAKILGIPERSIEWFIRSDEWNSLAKTLRPYLRGVMDTQFTRCINQTLAHIEDRLTYGEAMAFDAQNRPTARKPISVKTLSTLLGVLFDRQNDLQRVIEGKDPQRSSVELEKLAETLAFYGEERAKVINARKTALLERETPKNDAADVIDVED